MPERGLVPAVRAAALHGRRRRLPAEGRHCRVCGRGQQRRRVHRVRRGVPRRGPRLRPLQRNPRDVCGVRRDYLHGMQRGPRPSERELHARLCRRGLRRAGRLAVHTVRVLAAANTGRGRARGARCLVGRPPCGARRAHRCRCDSQQPSPRLSSRSARWCGGVGRLEGVDDRCETRFGRGGKARSEK